MATTTRLGIIPGILREEWKADVRGCVERLAALGFRGVESGDRGAELEPAAYVELLAAHGMEPIAVGESRDKFRNDLPAVIARARAVGVRHVLCYWGPAESREQVEADARLYNEAGRALRDAGVRLSYHNHEHEFRAVFDGRMAMDILLEATDPALVGLELDVAWAAFGGVDPAAYLRTHAARIDLVHLKDLWSLEERGRFTALGTGVVDLEGSVAAALEAGVEWLILEQDKHRRLSPLDTVTASALNLRERTGFPA